MKKMIILCVCAALVFSTTSCFLKPVDKDITFDSSQPLDLAPDVNWVLVTEPYLAFYTKADWTSPTVGHCRQGAVLQIIGEHMRTDENKTLEKWYKFDAGWLPASRVTVYSNRLRAEKAATQLENKEK